MMKTAVTRNEFVVFGCDLTSHFFGLEFFAHEDDLAIELQISCVSPLVSVNMIEVGGAGEITVEGESAGNLHLYRPIDQIPNELIMIDEFDTAFLARLFFNEPVEFQRVMFAGGADIVGDDIIVSDLVTLFGVIPEVTGIFDQLAAVIHQNVILRSKILVLGSWPLSCRNFSTLFGWSESGAAKMARIIIKRFTSADAWERYWKDKLKIRGDVILILAEHPLHLSPNCGAITKFYLNKSCDFPGGRRLFFQMSLKIPTTEIMFIEASH